MSFIKIYLSLLIVCLIFTFSAWTEPETSSTHEVLTRNQITETTLKNGLRVCLKKSDREPKEFEFQLFALGGIAHMPIMDQPSAWLASNIAWKSGLDHLTGDELECALDDHSLEMNVKIDFFDRKIEAVGPTSELAYCLGLTQSFFIHPQFNETGFKEALTEARKRLQSIGRASKLADEEMALKINFRNWHTIAPFHSLDLNKVDLQKVKKIFKQLFRNPAEFTFVMVGDFDTHLVMNLLEKTLGSLPTHPITPLAQLNPPSFPEGITKKELQGKTRHRYSITRLTFPLSMQSSVDPLLLDLLGLTLKQELDFELPPGELKKIGLNISYSFPLFPYLQPCWLVIKFSSSAQEASTIHQNIIKKMEKIKQRGITTQTLQVALQELMNRRKQNLSNSYDLFLLTNFYKVGWDIKRLYLPLDQNLQEKEMIKKLKDCYPSLDQYSIISLHP